jgi:hypothetical protein
MGFVRVGEVEDRWVLIEHSRALATLIIEHTAAR